MYAISNKQWREIIALLGAYAAEPSDGSTIARNKRRRALLMARKLAKKKMDGAQPNNAVSTFYF